MNKIKCIIPLLVLVLLVPVGTSNIFAQSESAEEDFTENTSPIGTVNESADIKLQEIKEKYQDLKNKHYTINEEFNTVNSTANITELKLDYIQTLKEFNILSYVEPERDYLAEWSALDAKIIILEELQYDNYAEPRQVIIDTLYVQMNEIEQESIASMVLDQADKKKLYNLEMELHNKYSNPDHETFVSNEFVEYVYVDHVQEKVYLVIDESKALAKDDISPISIAQKVMMDSGIDNVVIDFTEIIPLTSIIGTIPSNAGNNWKEVNINSPLDNKTKYIFYYNSEVIEFTNVLYDNHWLRMPSLGFNTTQITDKPAQIKVPKNFPTDQHHFWAMLTETGVGGTIEYEESDCFNIYKINAINSKLVELVYMTIPGADLSELEMHTLPDYCLPHTIADYPQSMKTYENIRGEQVSVYLSSALTLLERNYLVKPIN